MESILALDRELFLLLNGFHAPFWDDFFYQVTKTLTWLPLYAIVIWLMIRQYGWQAIFLMIGLALTVTLADQFTSSFMKPYFERLRPCWEPGLEGIIYVPRGCGGRYGFASSHAADTLGAALFCWYWLRKKNPWISLIFIWPLLSSYSRIYLAAHYPGDVLVGWVVGGLAAGGLVWVMIKIGIKTFDKTR